MNLFSPLFDIPVATLGTQVISLGHVVIAGLCGLLLLAIMLVLAVLNARARARRLAERLREQAEQSDAKLGEVLRSQSELQGRMQTMAELFGSRQAELNKALQERLDGMSQRIGQNLTDQTAATQKNLSQLQERLAVIDSAQTNIQQLAGNVVELQKILANKQTRGAFGQARMEAIIQDGLPTGAYGFQVTLSNGSRPDAVIHMPNDAPPLVIDAKFPLEAYEAIRIAADTPARDHAVRAFRRDVEVHLKAIADKYLIAGETHDTAFMFVPSEAIFGDIHEHHDGLIQRAHKLRVVIVSPSLLMLSVQVMQSVLKDVRMREQAHLIQKEVIHLIEDVRRLDDRVQKLQTHFGQASRDIDDILVSSGKVTKRGRRIEDMDFDDHAATLPEASRPAPRKVAAPSGQLKLRIVEDGSEPDA